MAHSRAKKEVMKDAHKNWIQGAIKPKNKGALHKSPGVPEGKKIPEKIAETPRNFKHKG